ncbi:hypothetical protein [Microbacterium sp. MYb64]|uniref:hypothetical protein n=1 Tax=Microbacterium sp. MYb64 TaxID=1848691 RepID=UPI0011B08146|nr:hypothetical protein [Microbacterium sp. MYb64]
MSELRILVDELGGHREVTRDLLGVLLAEGLQLIARRRVQIAGRDLIGKLGITRPIRCERVATRAVARAVRTIVAAAVRTVPIPARTVIAAPVRAVPIPTRTVIATPERTVAIPTGTIRAVRRSTVRTVPITTRTIIATPERTITITTRTIRAVRGSTERTVTLTTRAIRALGRATIGTVTLTTRTIAVIALRTISARRVFAERTLGTVAVDIASRLPRAIILAVARGLAFFGHVGTPSV